MVSWVVWSVGLIGQSGYLVSKMVWSVGLLGLLDWIVGSVVSYTHTHIHIAIRQFKNLKLKTYVGWSVGLNTHIHTLRAPNVCKCVF